MPLRAALVVRRAPLALALLLAGCSADGFLRPCADCAAGPGPVASPGEEPVKAEKPPPPRTLPEALCAYWKAVHDHPCAHDGDEAGKGEKNGKDSNGSENGGKKSPPAAGDSDRKDDAKETPGNGKPRGGPEGEGKKSPPAAGDAEPKKEPGNENGEKNGEKDDKKDDKEEAKERWFSAHAQATMIMQLHGSFPADYTGPRSLLPFQEAATSLTGTLFLAARLWQCDHYSGELVFNPEIAGGKGFSGVNGIAGFTNGDITRVGAVEPTPYFARLFLRQTIGFGGEQEKVEDEPNQIAGTRDVDRFTILAGKMAATDLIDNNRYSHDPRTQMANWSLMYNGAWDYPANVRGYTYGIGLELNQKWWALRYGAWAEPEEANGAPLDPHINKALGQALEWEGRWAVNEHPGRVRVMAYLNHAHMGDYREAVVQMPVNPDITQTQSYRFKYGFGMNFEQEVTRDLGVWGRLGWNDGRTETWAFTPIDRTAALGLLLKGRCWARPSDEVGLAGVMNGLAKDHRDYLAAGGLDFNLGDGALSYGLEQIIEVYYRFAIIRGMYATADFQQVFNPAYNRARGPVEVESLVVHIEF
jgi:high affinity Mn2+ porin